MSLIKVLVVAVAMAAGTWFVGWYMVPCIAAVYAVLVRNRSASVQAMIGAVLAWGALLARVSVKPAFTTLLARLGVLFGMQGAIVVVLALVFAAALAWAAARVVSGLLVRAPRGV